MIAARRRTVALDMLAVFLGAGACSQPQLMAHQKYHAHVEPHTLVKRSCTDAFAA